MKDEVQEEEEDDDEEFADNLRRTKER